MDVLTFLKASRRVLFGLLSSIPLLRIIPETRGTSMQTTAISFFLQKMSKNRSVPWPVHHRSLVTGWEYITVGINTAPGISFGNYIFATREGPISFGNYTTLAPNVCIAGVNHLHEDLRYYVNKGETRIGSYCWIGMNSVILPGVELGDHTVVGAGAVVTKSFPDGYCVIGGNPAKIITSLDHEKVHDFRGSYEYVGFHRLGKVKHER